MLSFFVNEIIISQANGPLNLDKPLSCTVAVRVSRTSSGAEICRFPKHENAVMFSLKDTLIQI